MGDRPYPSDFDPYYNQSKIYRQPRYYEPTSKKRKGNKVPLNLCALLVLGNQTKEAVFFVSNSSGEEDAIAER